MDLHSLYMFVGLFIALTTAERSTLNNETRQEIDITMVPKILAKIEGRLDTLEVKIKKVDTLEVKIKKVDTLEGEIKKIKGQPAFRCESMHKLAKNNPSYTETTYTLPYSRKFTQSAKGTASLTAWGKGYGDPAATTMFNMWVHLDKLTVQVQTIPASRIDIWAMACGI